MEYLLPVYLQSSTFCQAVEVCQVCTQQKERQQVHGMADESNSHQKNRYKALFLFH